ncbi:TetR/AcrR family transcriptional regulator [Desulfovibrio sp. OttesenSCG-928-I05]|nr:TetR/AcrR family transcriptional regulator [Desulfovibrio sp. OttesenSCG-928-I05]
MNDVRERILNAALTLFSANGFSGTTSSALARGAGIAEGTLFRHFRSKHEILLTLLRKVKGELIHSVEKRLESSRCHNGMERVLATVREYYSLASSPLPEFSIIFRDVLSTNPQDSNAEAREAVKDAYAYLISLLEQAIEAGREDGSIRPDVRSHATAAVLLGTVVGSARAIHFDFVTLETVSNEFLKECCVRFLAPYGTTGDVTSADREECGPDGK